MKNKPIKEKDVEKVTKSYSDFQDDLKILKNRIDYVIRKIGSLFGNKVKWWDWENYPWEGYGNCDGHFKPSFIRICIQLAGEWEKSDFEMISIINGGEWDFSYMEFPRTFLFEDFESKVRKGIKEYKEIHQNT
jgi:hypothetical protein